MTEDTEQVKITGAVINTGTPEELRTAPIIGNVIIIFTGTMITEIIITGITVGKGIAGILTAG